jgi:hypothetical protein
MVMHTVREVKMLDELLLDYGAGYWSNMRAKLRDVRSHLTAAGLWERDAPDEALAPAAVRALGLVGALAAWQRNVRDSESQDEDDLGMKLLHAGTIVSDVFKKARRIVDRAEREEKRARVE